MGCLLESVLFLLLALVLCSCADTAYFAPASPKAGVVGTAWGADSAGSVAVLDDVSNGIVGSRNKATIDGRESAFDSNAWSGAVTASPAGPDLRLPDVETPQRPAAGRKLIYSGAITVEVASPEAAMAELLARVAEWGGHMQSQVGNRLTVRVPAEHFDAAFDGVRNAGRVITEQRTAQDVTEEYRDLEIRLNNATKSRERLLALLEAAEKVDDILKIEKELRRLTDEIETMEGRRRYLADQVTLATLVAGFQAVAEPPPDRRRRRASRFRWVNLIGAERVMEDF